MKVAIAAGVLIMLTPTAAAAADTVPVTVKVADCENCSIMATWSKKGKAASKYQGSTQKVRDGKVRFDIPKGYWMYFTGTSPKAAVNAATILVTQYVGSSEGAKVSAKKSQTMNDGAHFCLKATKQTIKAQAALIKAGRERLLSLWANPQLAAEGTSVQGGIKGVYGTQNVLLCKGKYY